MEAFVKPYKTNMDTGLYLKYCDRPAGQGDKTQAVLWPIWVHKALYPQVQQPQMNLFQKVVLRLIRAKTHDAEDIANLTGMHVNLVKLIQAELLSRQWINNQATALTDKGIKAINAADQESEQLVSGYLFQDAYTGTLWPRIETHLATMEPLDLNARFPAFNLNRKTGYILNPHKLSSVNNQLPRPDTKEALKAWQKYRSDYNAARQLYSQYELSKQIRLTGIRLQDTPAELAWILIWITPSNNSKLWSIKDPFNIRDEAWWLTDILYQRIESDSKLLSKLGKLIGEPEPENQTVTEWLDSLKQNAQLQLMQEYPWASKDPDIATAIMVLLTRKKTIADGQNQKADLEAAITECQKLLEVLMQWLIKTYPANLGALPKVSKHDPVLNKNLLLALGLPAMTDRIAEALKSQNLTLVINSLSRPNSSLKALFFAATIGSTGHTEHPLKTLTAQQLQLDRLLKLAALRNQTSHGSSRHIGKQSQEITNDIASAQIEYALGFTEQFKEWING